MRAHLREDGVVAGGRRPGVERAVGYEHYRVRRHQRRDVGVRQALQDHRRQHQACRAARPRLGASPELTCGAAAQRFPAGRLESGLLAVATGPRAGHPPFQRGACVTRLQGARLAADGSATQPRYEHASPVRPCAAPSAHTPTAERSRAGASSSSASPARLGERFTYPRAAAPPAAGRGKNEAPTPGAAPAATLTWQTTMRP